MAAGTQVGIGARQRPGGQAQGDQNSSGGVVNAGVGISGAVQRKAQAADCGQRQRGGLYRFADGKAAIRNGGRYIAMVGFGWAPVPA